MPESSLVVVALGVSLNVALGAGLGFVLVGAMSIVESPVAADPDCAAPGVTEAMKAMPVTAPIKRRLVRTSCP